MAALESQRAILGDAVVDASIAGMQAKLVALGAFSEAESVQSLRQVGILFLDVVGATSLSQRLDPEATSLVMTTH